MLIDITKKSLLKIIPLILINLQYLNGSPYDIPELIVKYIEIAESPAVVCTDGYVSDFWEQIGDENEMILTTENNRMDSCGNYMFGHFSNKQDANISIKAAGTSQGLFILISIYDDIIIQGHDKLDIWFDTLDATTMYLCDDSCYVNPSWGFYYTSSSTRIEYILNDTIELSGKQYLTVFYSRCLSTIHWEFCSINADYKNLLPTGIFNGREISLEIISDSICNNIIELFVPWNGILGDFGTPGEIRIFAGRKFAFSICYLDADSIGDSLSALCWGNPPNNPFCPANSAESWGDLVLGPGFPDIIVDVSPLKRYNPSLKCRENQNKLKYFDLLGREKKENEGLNRITQGLTIIKKGNNRILSVNLSD